MSLKNSATQRGYQGSKELLDTLSSQLEKHAAQLASIAEWKSEVSTNIRELTEATDVVLRLRKGLHGRDSDYQKGIYGDGRAGSRILR